MSHLNDHRSTVSLVERYIGTPYDKIKELLDNLPQLLELLAYYKNEGSVNDATFTYAQTTPSNIWVVTHNLQKFPSVETVDLNLTEMEGEVVHISEDVLEIRFNNPVSGFAYVN
jgi:hypothetical protein